MNNIHQLDHQYIAQTYARFAPVLVKGQGCTVWDNEGNAYLDLTSGIGVNSLGWGDEHWLAAVQQQTATLAHTSNLFYTEPSTQLARTLVEKSQLKTVFLANSGAEANECAIKTARKYSHDRYGQNRHRILTLNHSFHGRTISTLAATGQEHFHQHFFPFTEGFEHLPANDIHALQQRIAQANDVCAIMLEVIQGEGGLNTLQADYLQTVQKLCDEHDILFIIDEVQTGIGRTGKWFAYQHFDLKPDIITLAKGLGGGLPIGAVVFGEKCANTLGQGDHGSTFGANPVCCAAANAVLARLNDDFLRQVCEKGAMLRAELAKLPHVVSVSGLGLMVGVGFESRITAKDVVNAAMKRGVLTLTAKDKLRLLPPLIISENELKQAIDVLKDVLNQMA